MGWKSACMGIMLGYNGHEQLFEGFRTTSTSYRYRVVWKIYHEVQKTNEVHPYWYIHERFPVYMHNYMVPIDICVVLFQGSLHILVGNKASVQTLTGGGIKYMEPCDHSHYRDKGGWFLQITLHCTTWDHAHTSPALCIVHELLIVCYIVEISFANTSTHFLPPSTCTQMTSVGYWPCLLGTMLGLFPTQVLNIYLASTVRNMQEVLADRADGYIILLLQVFISIVLMLYVLQKARVELAKLTRLDTAVQIQRI